MFLFSLLQVVPKLSELILNEDHVKMIRNDQFQDGLFNEVWKLGLDSFNEDDLLVFPYAFLERFSKLTSLNVSHSSFKEIFSCDGPPVDPSRKVPLLTSLSLTHLDQLQNIWNVDSDIHPVLQSFKSLEVNHCSWLINLIPSFASFDNLLQLSVFGSHCLAYLFTTLTAKSLVRLSSLVIKDCKMMEEIVTNEGKDVEEIIVLKRLKDIKLIDLPVLKYFCSQTCTFEFPSLTYVSIRGCSKMMMFCLGVLITPLLEDVKGEENEECWEGNLNKTLEQLFLEKVSSSSSSFESHRGCFLIKN